MLDGFLPTARPASFMLDVVVLAMVAVVPILSYSIYVVKYQRNYALHKMIQVGLGVVLLIAVALFEIDIRMKGGWRPLVAGSPYIDTYLPPLLYIHLFFSCSTSVLWLITIVQGLRKFPNPPVPNEYSPTHLRWAKLAALTMYCTSVTGWIFYWMGFIAT